TRVPLALRLALCVGFFATITESDSSRPCIIRLPAFPMRTTASPFPPVRPSAHARVFDHAGPFGHSRWPTRPYFLPPSERRPRPEYNFFRGSMTGLCTPYRRFAPILTNCLARLGADAVRNSFIATDFHRLVPAGLPAHSD